MTDAQETAMRYQSDLNGRTWEPDPPEVDNAEAAMLAVAPHEVDEPWLAQWLRERVHFA